MMRHHILRMSENALNDNNGLETDIMRFFAIISLCLMVVFSLVQSLPFKGEDNPKDDKNPELLSKNILELKIDILNQQLNDLLTKNKHLKTQVKEHESKKDLAAMIKQIKENLNASQQQLEKSQQQVDESQEQIGHVKEDNYKLAKQLLEINSKLVKANHRYQEAVNKAEKAQEQVRRYLVNSLPVKTIKPNKPPIKVVKKQKGFSLEFTNDKSLINLIKKQMIGYYLISGKRLFQFNWESTGWKIRVVKNKPHLYTMHIQTVPDLLLKVAKLQVIAFSKSKPLFGVVLQQNSVNRINSYMKQYKGGQLMINHSGQVEIKNASK